MPVERPYVAVIGGGPAGLMAAERLSEAGAAVTVFEHKRSVGRKFLLAGRGGLNITHGEALDDLLGRYGSAKALLTPAVQAFSPDDLRDWCAGLGEPTFVGTSDRVFPASFRATPLLRAWLGRLDEAGVKIETAHRWRGWTVDGANELTRSDGSVVTDQPHATVFALGGASWPRVGSDGSWTKAFTAAGIRVTELQAANCGVGVAWSDTLANKFEGQPIKNVVLSCANASARGDAIITRSGLEGGPIYALGPAIRAELNHRGQALVTLDLHPDLAAEALVERLSKRRPKASAASWLSSAGIAPVAISLARDATANQLPGDPSQLAGLFKALPITVTRMASLERAISSAGGVADDEVDDRFMIRRRPGVFVAGEMIDWEAPTGGYLLQACFSTGVAAAEGALAWLSDNGPK